MNQTKKTVCIFVTNELGIWYLLLLIAKNKTRNRNIKTGSLMFHTSYISYCIGLERRFMIPNFVCKLLKLNITFLFYLLLFANVRFRYLMILK